MVRWGGSGFVPVVTGELRMWSGGGSRFIPAAGGAELGVWSDGDMGLY